MTKTKLHPSPLPAMANGARIDCVTPLTLPQVGPQDLYAAALAYAPFGAAFLSETGMISHLNRTLSQWLDRPLAQLAEISLLELILPEDRPLMERALNNTLRHGRAFHDLEVRLVGTQGRPRWISLSLNRLPVTQGQQVVAFMADITRRKKNETELMHLANTDHLTGLSNRMVFDETLHRAVKNARRYDRRGAVLYIDLNDFKTINDTYGHKAGDAILQEVGRVLTHIFRETDTVARIGGDEFAVIMEEVSAPQATFKGISVERAVRKLEIEAHGQKVCCSASVGVQLFCGAETKIEEILMAADKAMYQHKSAQKGAVQ